MPADTHLTRLAGAALAGVTALIVTLPAATAQDQIEIIEREQLPDIIIDPPEDDTTFSVEEQPSDQQEPPSEAEPGRLKSSEATPSIDEIQPTPEKKETRLKNPVAEFSGLDKITGRTISFDVYVNETVQFGALQVTPKVCYSRPDAEEPKTDTFVEVDEITLDRKIRRIFTGWMFAESPGLSAVEHPVYDVWLKSCKQKSDVPPPQASNTN